MKNIFLSLLAFLFLAGPVRGASLTMWASPTGSGSDCTVAAPCTVDQARANGDAVVPTGEGTGQGHVLYAISGTYTNTSFKPTSGANWDGGSLIGVKALGDTTPAAKGEVVFSYDGDIIDLTVLGAVNNFTLKNVSGTGIETSTKSFMRWTGTGFWADNVAAYDLAGRYFTTTSGTGTISNFLFAGGHGSAAAYDYDGATLVMHSGLMVPGLIYGNGSPTAGTYVVNNQSDGTLELYNVDIVGCGSYCVANTGTGSTTVINGILSTNGLTSANVPLFRSTGTLTYQNTLVAPSAITHEVTAGTVTDGGNNITTTIHGFVAYGREAILIPIFDDPGLLDAMSDYKTVFDARGLKGSYFANGKDILTPAYLAKMVQWNDTFEIVYCGRSHDDMSKTGNIFSVTKAGSTVEVQRA
jgi:hypothetical protein